MVYDPKYLNKDDLNRFLAMAREVQHEVNSAEPEVGDYANLPISSRTWPPAHYFDPSMN